MNTPSQNPILGAVLGVLLSTGVFAKEPNVTKPEDRPVPPIPADVLKQGSDAVLDWLLKHGLITPEYIRGVVAGKVAEAVQKNESPFTSKLRAGYGVLPETTFQRGTKRPWEAIAKKLTPDVLAKASKLQNAKIYGVNENGELVIGDGGREVPAFTRHQTYVQIRSALRHDGLSLMTKEEYISFNFGSMEIETMTWLESGEKPAFAFYGLWAGSPTVQELPAEDSNMELGARRVVRVIL